MSDFVNITRSNNDIISNYSANPQDEGGDEGIAGLVTQLAEIVKQTGSFVTPEMYGGVGDGVTDDTTALQNMFNAIKNGGIVFAPANKTYLTNSISIDSSSNIFVMTKATFMLKPTALTQTEVFHVTNSKHIYISCNFDLNNSNITWSEFIHAIRIENACDKLMVEKCYMKNLLGDGIAISGNSNNITIKDIRIKNTFYTGRNAISIINGKNFIIENITTEMMGRSDMPGGIDLEPNLSTDTIQNVFIRNVILDTLGTGAMSVYHKAGGTISNVTIENVFINQGSTTASGSAPLRINGTNGSVVDKIKVSKIDIIGVDGITHNVNITGATNVVIDKLTSLYSFDGVYIDTSSYVKINGKVKDATSHGVEIANTCSNLEFDLIVENANKTSGGYGFAYRFASSANVNTIVIKGQAKLVGNTMRAVNLDSAVITNGILRGLDASGYSNYIGLTGNAGTLFSKENVIGYNEASAMPSAGWWKTGDYIRNTAPTIQGTSPTRYYIDGWKRITTGGTNTLNTDWVQNKISIE